ncbi:MFS general substrate transporter [Neocallimastix lanati (nom. inval.)]|jgi:MFS family permease|uniref:MFS general substrate transporter n=1 Tax=Neocallimastix californiae TaxID=1754190 RepID=A0A1Y2F747_9FUNG|nr:MFS general substrate transporter [Neocallimastix sp. JGI-2020a]ORY78745.1 MFS general substrate transporter [Neocallimastix californiae]|eukprot:ORY78745.1 MFS general substrate transporter [Neocallimastix californiae]
MEITELSFTRKILLVIFGVFSALTTSGIIFGFQALKSILIENKVYFELCESTKENNEITQCNEQILKFSLMFSLASTATNAFSLPIGFLLDKYGPRVSCYIGSILFFFGCLLLGLSGPSFNGYLIGFLLLGIAGPFIFISTLHFSTVFPKKSGLIMAALTGSFDASSVIFLLFNKLYYFFDKKYSVQTFFLVYMIVPIIIFIANSFLMPKTSLQWSESESEDLINESDEFSSLLNNDKETSIISSTNNYQSIISEHEQNENRNKEKDIKEMTSWEQMKTKEYILITLLTSIFMIRLNFYISTTEEQFSTISNDEDGIKNTVQFFNIMLPLAGVLSIMPIGWLLDNFKIYIGFTVLCLMALIFGVLSLIPSLSLQFISIIIFVFMRPLLYTSGNDFSSKTFGFKTFGRVYGLMNLISSIVNFGQYAVEYLVVNVFNGQFIEINFAFTILTSIMFYLPYYLFTKERKNKTSTIV